MAFGSSGNALEPAPLRRRGIRPKLSPPDEPVDKWNDMIRRLSRLAAILVLMALWGCGGHARRGGSAVEIADPDRVTFHAAHAPKPGYVLGTGDQFDVEFLFQRSLNTRVTVRPDGRVALPIVGEMAAAGRTPSELDSLLTLAYGTYYRDPELTVNVLTFAEPSVYVLGHVQNQRAVPLKPGMTMLQAIAVAGGLHVNASTGSTMLLRRVDDETAYAQRVDLGDMLSGKVRAYDMLLTPYDIIYVPETTVSKVERFVRGFFGGMINVPLLYLRGWEMFNTEEVYDTFLTRPNAPAATQQLQE